jgi:endogenous inhibitor of DNA gyrase (YacG/DUF329 family)
MTKEPANENQPKGEGGRCPICSKPTALAYKPFCSKRCADVDLNRWLTGGYAIPLAEEENGPGSPDEEEQG